MSDPDLPGFMLVDDGRADAVAAEKLFPNQGLHPAARAFAASHRYAIQYLAQAPVLALAASYGGPGVRRMNALYIAHKAGPVCDRGAPLREMMAAFSLAFPLRKLTSFALSPSALPAIQALSKMDPAVLGRIIPEMPGPQRVWIGALSTWLNCCRRRSMVAELHFSWAAERMSHAGVGSARAVEVADFAISGEPFNDAWQWPRAEEEMLLWHDRLNLDRGIKQMRIGENTRIDHGRHPDELEIEGYRFTALRTPKEIQAEGRAMRHCVASYVPQVMNGTSKIISVRQGEKRLATLELTKTWGIVQLKARMNAAPEKPIKLAAAAYAQECRKLTARSEARR